MPQFLTEDESAKLRETFDCGVNGNIHRVRPLLNPEQSMVAQFKELKVGMVWK